MVALVHGQGTPYDSPVQYHIQTDEGPERFFRFQTETGQYREEKRLTIMCHNDELSSTMS